MTIADHYDLGSHTMPVTTTSSEAQLWFDRGLLWTYGFNHEEAIQCFHRATEADPKCAMAFWGIAYASGPNYNKQWDDFDPVDLSHSLQAAHAATSRAVGLRDGISSLEQGLIRALTRRYPSPVPVEDCSLWNLPYADAMRDVYIEHGDNLDVAALFAQALMNLTPWKMWDSASGAHAPGGNR